MDNDGIVLFPDQAITAPGTFTTDWIEDLDGMQSLSFLAKLLYGTGGTNVDVFLQTSFDGGTTAEDLAHIQFGAAAGNALVNLDGMAEVSSPQAQTDGTLGAGDVNQGLLGDRLRIKWVVTGTYAASTVLSCRGMAR